MAEELNDLLPPNFPRRREVNSPRTLTVPKDLVTDNRSFYTGIQFVPYNYQLATSSSSSAAVSNLAPRVLLPIPRKINDNQTVVWEAESFTSTAASIASNAIALRGRQISQAASSIAGIARGVQGPAEALTGFAVNPFLWMLFKQPNFKEYNFTWTLTASNERESNDIANVINYFKENMLPTKGAAGAIYGYPDIALIKFYPNDIFMFKFKPCAVLAVASDYTAGGGPSFFKRTGAPTVINFSVLLKEIDLWTREDYRQNAYR